jgi:hypothetical protein
LTPSLCNFLAGFEIADGSKQVHVFDKQNSRSFLAGVHNVAGEHGFYDIEFDEITLTFEPALATLEGEMAGIVAEILDRAEIGFLSVSERELIARFVLAQSMRTRQFLESVHEGGVALANALDEKHPGSAAELGFNPDFEESRLIALRLLGRSGDWVPLIQEKAWGLYETSHDSPFWISDHPVVMHNNVNKSDVRGTIGLGVPGIEIYLPISSRYCLGFICPTLRELTEEAYAKSLRVKTEMGIELPTHEQIGAIRDGFELGFPIPSRPENVDYFNSLQVLHGERFVFSSTDEFEMVEEMIQVNPDVRHGPRPTVQ